VASKEKKKSSIVGVPLYVAIAVALIAGLVYAYVQVANSAGRQVIELTPEAKAYIGNLKLSGVDIKAHDSYLGQRVIELTGNIANNGDRAIVSVAVICVFYDSNGLVVLRERSTVVGAKQGGLKPGETKAFRMPFDGVSENWNKEMPTLVIASIQFS